MVRDRRMQPFNLELVAIVGRHAQMAAIAIIVFLGGVGGGQVPRETGRLLRKPPLAPMGRKRQFITYGCSLLHAIPPR